MIAVRCPACNERVEGSSSRQLSASVRKHLSEVHRTSGGTTSGVAAPGTGASSPEEFRGGADGFTESSRSGSTPSGPGQREPRGPVNPTPGGGIAPGGKVDYKEKSFEVADSGLQMGMGRTETGIETPEGTGGSEGTRGISGFDCPVCGNEIRGGSEEELSSSFTSHLVSAHRDEPFVTRLMERVGGR